MQTGEFLRRYEMDERVVIFLLVGYILGMLTIVFINAPKRS